MKRPQSSTLSKVCPLCGSRYGAEVERCPEDGRILIRVRKSAEGGEAEKSSGVRLSSATEELLGDILTSSEDSADVQGSSSSNALAGLDLDFDIDVHLPEDSELSLSSDPLSSLELPGLSGGENEEEASEDPLEGLGLGGGGGDLFSNLALEVDGLDEGVDDDEVTRRVVREDLSMEATRRSEMPPEFAEALAREKAEEAAQGESAAEGEDGEDEEDKPQRPIPRYSQLQVKQASYVLSRERRPILLPLIALGLVVVLIVLIVVWAVTS